MKGFMYILKCADGSYYTGSTTNLELRLQQHWAGEGANHTKKHLPVELVYFEEFNRIDKAFFREKQVQGWSRKKKAALILGFHDKLPGLSIAYRDIVVASRASATGASEPEVASSASATGASEPEVASSASATGASEPEVASSASATGASEPEVASSASATGASEPEVASSASATGASEPEVAEVLEALEGSGIMVASRASATAPKTFNNEK